MKCPSRTEVLESAYALVDGETPELMIHTEVCARCRSVLEDYVRTIREVKEGLEATPDTPDTPCMDGNAVAAYVDGGLDDRRRAAIEAHLVDCRACRKEVSELLDLTEALPGMDIKQTLHYLIGLGARSLQLIAHPAEGFLPLQSAGATLLGSSDNGDAGCETYGWKQKCGDLTLECCAVRRELGGLDLSIILTTDLLLPESARVFLHHEGRLVLSERTRSGVPIRFPGLAPGVYSCVLEISPSNQVSFTVELRPM
jgi:hypothetical protein